MIFSYSIRAAKKDPEAFVKIYDHYALSTYRYLEFRSKSKQDAEDLTSEVWETVLKNITKFKSNNVKAFNAWLFTITRNTLHQYFRTIKHPKNNGLDLEKQEHLLINHENIPSKIIIKKHEANQLKMFIETLPEKQQDIVLMKFFGDLRNKEIAKILNISEKTVASNLCRGLETLKHLWKKMQ